MSKGFMYLIIAGIVIAAIVLANNKKSAKASDGSKNEPGTPTDPQSNSVKPVATKEEAISSYCNPLPKTAAGMLYCKSQAKK